jgi:hypothetical protein
MTGMTRMIFGATFIAVLAISVHSHTAAEAAPSASADMAQPQSVQSAGVHRLAGSSFHALHAGF